MPDVRRVLDILDGQPHKYLCDMRVDSRLDMNPGACHGFHRQRGRLFTPEISTCMCVRYNVPTRVFSRKETVTPCEIDCCYLWLN